jgi:ATP-dependent RNA helicase SUPV3L1/SUV3
MADMRARGRTITAVLGPTNTGKTHLAVERMLTYSSGIIGFPLRLLAREIYDRLVAIKGARAVALITGEEKILPKNPRYILATVESMPLDQVVDFLAVDEIQLAADRERGHVFTDRLLHARGRFETMFLGADTIRPLIRRLVPEAEFIGRPRFSDLSFNGHKKLGRLAPRSAVVAFSAQDVYALAEVMRAQRGGCAVVLGALSPRTRNAQVAMYQAGEIDYLVATDAIGMGLNMDLNHVAFSADRKFDGHHMRRLNPAEMAQIAGRAGRYLTNGSFGTTADLTELDSEIVEAVEQHRFAKIREVFWRNSDLSYRSLDSLLYGLDKPPDQPGLRRVHDGSDHLTLLALARDDAVRERAEGAELVRVLWDVCQIPDFGKTLADSHIHLARRIFLNLAQSGALSETWIDERIAGLDRADGDIDTLTTRISHIRTWTYIAHHAAWLADARHWQERAREVEDRLSDALHERLTQRFVDRRAAVLVQRMRDSDSLNAAFDESGEVIIEGHPVGHIEGFCFLPDDPGVESKAVSSAAQKVLGAEIQHRVGALEQDDDKAFRLSLDKKPAQGRASDIEVDVICWRNAPVAKLITSDNVLKPGLQVLHGDALSGPQRERVRRRLADWLERRITWGVAPLAKLRTAELTPVARALAFQLSEALGCLPRRKVSAEIAALDKAARAQLLALDVRIGSSSVYCPAMLKTVRSEFAGLLWAVNREAPPPKRGANPAAVGFVRDQATPPDAYNALGFIVLGARVLRADMAERLIAGMAKRSRAGPFVPDTALLAMAGCAKKQFPDLAAALGYRSIAPEGDEKGAAPRYARKPRPAPTKWRKKHPSVKIDPNSPFAALGGHALFGAGSGKRSSKRPGVIPKSGP